MNGNNDRAKTKEQLIKELAELRSEVASLEKLKARPGPDEEESGNSGEQLGVLFESAVEGILIAEIKTRKFKYANPAICRMLGYTVEELTGMGAEDIHPKDGLENMLSGFEAQSRGEKPLAENILCLRNDGSTIRVDIRASMALIDGIECNIGFFIDITERKRAEDELRKSHEQLRELTRHIESIREEERRRITREIHDELGQTLTALIMDIAWLRNKLPKDQRSWIEKTKSMSKLISQTAHMVKRIATELRPSVLDDLGLAAAIEWLTDEFQNRTGINLEVTIRPEGITTEPELATAIFRILQEALTNVVRHTKATKVKVSLVEKAGKMVLKVVDNGKGISEEQISAPRSFGLIGLRERIHPWSGTLDIRGGEGEGNCADGFYSDEREKEGNKKTRRNY